MTQMTSNDFKDRRSAAVGSDADARYGRAPDAANEELRRDVGL